MGLEHAGAHGTTAALAMLNDAVKKGGIMASSYVGGLSGAFIPVSEDAGMIEAAKQGVLTFDKLEAMTCVCSVGLDMIAIPGSTPESTISGIIADEMAIGMINKKTTAVRIIPVPGKEVGDYAVYGGLFPTFVNNANAKGVDCLLWGDSRLIYSKAFSNENMDATLKQWKDWGIKGIKVDFWEDESKEAMARIEKLYQTAAKHHMLVNLHGCTRPSGLRRTYPHIMTQEGIYGGEQQFWNPKLNTAQHHLDVLFTRNVVGAMDFTPGDFATWRGSLLTQRSQGHHLALTTLFESSIVHIAESAENLKLPNLEYQIQAKIHNQQKPSFLCE